MANWRIEVVSSWTENGGYAPLLREDHGILNQSDITAQPSVNLMPDPNLYNVLVECTEAVLDAINADSAYLVLWQELIPEDII